MEQVFNGYSEACQQAALESKKQKDKILYVFNKHIDGVKYVLTDNENYVGSLLNPYKNGMIYDKSKEPKTEEKPSVVIPPKEEIKPIEKESVAPVIASDEVKESLKEPEIIEQPNLNGTEIKEDKTKDNE